MRISKYNKPVACITMGYPAGIGPEIIARSLASPKIRGLANFLIVGDKSVFKRALSLSAKRLRYHSIETEKDIDFRKHRVLFFDMKNLAKTKIKLGVVSRVYGRASIDYIAKAVSLIGRKKADILITGPIHKHAAELAGFKYSGHTEYLAHLSSTKDYAMMLIGGPLKVILVTTHLPIKEVPSRLNRNRIAAIIELAAASLKHNFKIRNPRIAVCGLNPHAGEDGLLGNEEKRIIEPAIKKARRRGINCVGPIAADGLFFDLYQGCYDASICMYHDQGLVALKMLAREESVNITLGLPFIRTSPGHGTALDIAKKGIASAKSMDQAIRTAVTMFKG